MTIGKRMRKRRLLASVTSRAFHTNHPFFSIVTIESFKLCPPRRFLLDRHTKRPQTHRSFCVIDCVLLLKTLSFLRFTTEEQLKLLVLLQAPAYCWSFFLAIDCDYYYFAFRFDLNLPVISKTLHLFQSNKHPFARFSD